MTAFTLMVIMGVLMIIGGIALLATPLTTFMSTGYFIIILFFISGIFGIIRAIRDKRYDIDFFFAILSLILGILGFVLPGAAIMNNFMLLYMAAGWFFVRGVMSIFEAIRFRELGFGFMVLGIILGVLELVLAIYSIAHPAVLAISLGILIGFYYIESGINAIILGSMAAKAAA